MLLTVDLERLEIHQGDLVLDAGCGEGRHCFGMLSHGARVVGFDLDLPSMRDASKRLRKEAAKQNSLGEMTQGNIFQLPFADATYDRVICSEVMEHVHSYQDAAKELARVTKPGGRLAITIPTETSEHLYLRMGDEYFESPGGHIRIFKPKELAIALSKAGLTTKGVGFAHGFHTPYWVLRSIMHLPNADDSALVRMYRQFLIIATGSKLMFKLEKWLNFVCPKSLILYAEKPVRGTR
ncbi:MAG: 2-polyprenyl-3-methyl-5-hydroxy-6-metoxy-1,4-benzoquinol methylase [Myxococcota bacterium]